MSFSAADAEIRRFSFITIQWTLDQIPILMTCTSPIDPLIMRGNILFEQKIVNFILPIGLSMCFGCPKEPSH